MKKNILLLFAFAFCINSYSQKFDEFFKDSTLRIDYIFSGNTKQQQISVDKLNCSPRWYGKRNRLSEIPVEGNGQITVRDHKSHKVIYKNSFSTLFQEWLSYDEAKTTSRSFQNVFIVPMPKNTADITVDLRNNRREIMTTFTHQVVPTDILIRKIGFKDRTKYINIQQPQDTSNCIHIAYVAEGYKENEMNVFLDDVNKAVESLFFYEPFKSLKSKFSIVAVESPSIDSGTSEPGKGIWKKTALSSHFDTFYSERYLTTLNLEDLHDWLAGIPYEHIIVLVNSSRYGGGGILNSYNLTTAHNPRTKPVVVHEFGHSFAGLGDEYGYDFELIPMYPKDVEPWEPNLTTLADFHGKWEDMISHKTKIPTPVNDQTKKHVGVFEGGGYAVKGVYRPMFDCRMRTNEYPEFCPVCRRAITRLINFYTEK